MEVYIAKNYPESYTNFSKLFNETNNSNTEIEFLTKSKVEELINEFDFEIRNNIEVKQNYLLKRDLYNDRLYEKLDALLSENKDFMIIKSLGFKFEIGIIDNQSVNMIKIEEINSDLSIFITDSIDEIIIDELSKPIKYSSLIREMKTYLEDDGDESISDFLQLLNLRLRDYVLSKIISIYH